MPRRRTLTRSPRASSAALADLAVASPFVNLEHVGFTVDPATYPKLAAYVARILARPSFAGNIAAEKKMLGG